MSAQDDSTARMSLTASESDHQMEVDPSAETTSASTAAEMDADDVTDTTETAEEDYSCWTVEGCDDYDLLDDPTKCRPLSSLSRIAFLHPTLPPY